MSLAGWGALAGGIGQLAGGLGLGSKKQGISSQIRAGARGEAWRLRHLKERSGIHPLFAMGSSPSVSPTISAGGGKDLSQIGEGLQRAAEGVQTLRQKPNPMQAQLQALGLRQAEAETRKSEYAADMAHMDLQRRRQLNASNNERDLAPGPGRPGASEVDQETTTWTGFGPVKKPRGIAPVGEIEDQVGEFAGGATGAILVGMTLSEMIDLKRSQAKNTIAGRRRAQEIVDRAKRRLRARGRGGHDQQMRWYNQYRGQTRY